LVFEQVGAPQELFRIHRYDNGSIPFDKIKAEYEQGRGSITKLYEEIDRKTFVYRVIAITD